MDNLKRFYRLNYDLSVMVGGILKTTKNETIISGDNPNVAIAFFKQETFITLKHRKPTIKINSCIEVE